MHREAFVGSTEDGNKVIFERLDGTFGGIPAMVVWRDKLIVDSFLS